MSHIDDNQTHEGFLKWCIINWLLAKQREQFNTASMCVCPQFVSCAFSSEIS